MIKNDSNETGHFVLDLQLLLIEWNQITYNYMRRCQKLVNTYGCARNYVSIDRCQY